MRELKRKPDDEMLIVHKLPTKPDPDKSGRDRGGPGVAALERAELASLKRRVSVATDASEKRDLVAQIQRRFGNEAALQVVREMREGVPGDDLGPCRPRPGPGKGKA